MLQLTDVTLHRGDKALFDRLNLTVYSSHKVGIVGRNGAGKTTLFDVIRRRLQPEEGMVDWPTGWRLSALDQYVEPSPRSALDFVLDGDADLRRVERAITAAEERGDDHALATLYSDYEDVGGYDAHARGGEILGGLGFAATDFDKPHRAFSGGWRIRLHLARALMTPSDFLLLDEPTNHLDLEATLWLETWVRKYPGTLLTIAHDRDFLDRTVQEIVHVENGQAAVYSGNYSGFERQRAEALTRQAGVYKHQQQRVAEIQRFVDRFRAKASKARQVQSRVKALERMEQVAPVHAESPYRFAFSQPKKISNPTLMLDNAALGYGGKAVLGDVTLRVYPERPHRRAWRQRRGQDDAAALPGERTDASRRSFHAGQALRRGLFRATSARVPRSRQERRSNRSTRRRPSPGCRVSRRSTTWAGGAFAAMTYAGARRRSRAARRPALCSRSSLARNPPCWCWTSPPTTWTCRCAKRSRWPFNSTTAALLLVSHDRHLLHECVDDFWLVADGGVTRFKGDLDAYTALRQARSGRRRQRRKAARRSRVRPLQQRQRKIEAEIETHTLQVDNLERRLTAASTRNQVDEVTTLAAERKQVGAALEELETAWLATQEEIDALGAEEAGR